MSKAKPNDTANVLVVAEQRGERRADTLARTLLRPTVGAAMTTKAYGAKYGDDLELNALVTALSERAESARRGDLKRADSMLMVQAHTLDAIFNELARRAALNMGEHLNATEMYLRLALKAQSQCRTTLETLAAIKNPQPVAFVRQANIAAGPQQVNNGVLEPTPARETEFAPNKLSEAASELHSDTRSSALACRANPQVETVGEIDRAENAGR